MYNTYARPARDLRNNYADVVRMLKEHNQVLITNNGKGEAVLISAEDYAGYEEYLHKQYIIEELKKTQAEIDAGKAEWIPAEEVFAEARKIIERKKK
ncbi:MAG: type II toxin-antitoxin system prevent-host-death family antitoxin [Oscillospiraceae bacterium]|nr:type II toxin-antitoxin system prevent-host-death family antitoxin [Oscillospiraceae bacterium]